MSWNLTLKELVAAVGGQCLSQQADSFTGVGTDTRKNLSDQIFIALKGDSFDAHQFLTQAVQMGAKALVVHDQKIIPEDLKNKVTLVLVPDTLKALQDLGRFWRRKQAFKVIGITGSNGKTTTKGFTQTLLEKKFRTHSSQGSFNNHWGVPISLLDATPGTEVHVQEMGMNKSGEIKALCVIAEPDVVVVTMVGRAHIGELGSQAAVVAAKEEIYNSSPKAIKIFNLDNEYTMGMLGRHQKSASGYITFSTFHERADVHLRVHRMNFSGLEIKGHIRGVSGTVQIPIIGRQNVVNLMAATSIALAMGMEPEEIWPQLAECRTAWGRNQIVPLRNGAKVLFDAYNANPESVSALLKNFYEMDISGRKVVVLGEMLELGAESAKAHREIGEMVGETNFDIVWFIGPHAPDFEAGLKAAGFKNTSYISNIYEQTLALKIGSMLNEQDIAVIKGSRGMKMEQVLTAWDPVRFDLNKS